MALHKDFEKSRGSGNKKLSKTTDFCDLFPSGTCKQKREEAKNRMKKRNSTTAKKRNGRDGRTTGEDRFYIYHRTFEDPEKIKREGLKAVFPGEIEGRGELQQDVQDRIKKAEQLISEAGERHDESVFFFNDLDQVDKVGSVVVVDVRKLNNEIRWGDTSKWESLVSHLGEEPDILYEDSEDPKSEFQYDLERLAEEFAESVESYDVSDEMPDRDPEREVWVKGDIPPEAIVEIRKY